MTTQSMRISMMPILIGCCAILLLNFSIRSSFGVFQIPIADEFGWPRADFSTAIAIQNLAWGLGQPIFSAFAERFGDRRALVLGTLVYALGLGLSAYAITPAQHWALEVLVGFGVAGTGFGIILAIIGRAASDKNRSMAMAIATAFGSGGQIIGPPLAEWMLSFLPWQSIFLIFAAASLAIIAFLPLFRGIAPPPAKPAKGQESMGAVVAGAFRDPTFTFIILGFFSCGYQLGFVTAHFPAMITEMCGPIVPGSLLANIGISSTSALGAAALAVIGVTNIAGTLLAGWLGGIYPRKYLLAGIYTLRAVSAAAFILLPITPLSVVIFSVVFGALWLATVPLTSGLVGHIYGLRYMGTLYGFVFLSHQIGSFMGIWLGGRLYDAYGGYSAVWWLGVAVGAFSAIVHLPVREKPLAAAAA